MEAHLSVPRSGSTRPPGVSIDDLERLGHDARSGCSDAQLSYGTALRDGVGVASDPAEGWRWIVQSADNGNALAAEQVAKVLSEYPDKWRRKYDRALLYYQAAFEGGRADAAYKIGSFYEQGKVLPCSEAEALRWYRKGILADSPLCHLRLASAYFRGELGVRVDRMLGKRHFEYYQQKARQDDDAHVMPKRRSAQSAVLVHAVPEQIKSLRPSIRANSRRKRA